MTQVYGWADIAPTYGQPWAESLAKAREARMSDAGRKRDLRNL